MAEMFYDSNHLPDLMSKRADLYPHDEIVRQYLEGTEFIDEDIEGYEESLTYYPESRE